MLRIGTQLLCEQPHRAATSNWSTPALPRHRRRVSSSLRVDMQPTVPITAATYATVWHDDTEAFNAGVVAARANAPSTSVKDPVHDQPPTHQPRTPGHLDAGTARAATATIDHALLVSADGLHLATVGGLDRNNAEAAAALTAGFLSITANFGTILNLGSAPEHLSIRYPAEHLALTLLVIHP